MCCPALCTRCGKTTWDGCGTHVADVMSTVPHDQQCICDTDPSGGAGSPSSEGASGRR